MIHVNNIKSMICCLVLQHRKTKPKTHALCFFFLFQNFFVCGIKIYVINTYRFPNYIITMTYPCDVATWYQMAHKPNTNKDRTNKDIRW